MRQNIAIERIKELTEGYKAQKSEDKQISFDWDAATGDGID